VIKLWGRREKKNKEKEWKLPTLKGKSKIEEGERLSSLEKGKEVSIKKRHRIRQSSIPKKKYWVTNIVFWYQWLDWLFIKEKVGFALWSMGRECLYLKLT